MARDRNPQRPRGLLEPCAGKPARTVLRGPWRSNAPGLPDHARGQGTCPTVAGGRARLWSPRERRKRRWPGGARLEHGRCSHWVVGAGRVLDGGRRAQWSDRRGRAKVEPNLDGVLGVVGLLDDVGEYRVVAVAVDDDQPGHVLACQRFDDVSDDRGQGGGADADGAGVGGVFVGAAKRDRR